MPKLTVLSDFDRTLFDTDKFFEDVWALAEELYPVDADAERQRAPEFFHYHGDWHDYRFFEHLAGAAGPTYDYQKFIAAAHQGLKGEYLYDDVTPAVLESIDAIITFGNEAFQSFKLSTCPRLNEIETHIILGSKGSYIAENFPGPSVLIDDRYLEAEIMAPAMFVRIDRTPTPQVNEREFVITSFDQLSDMLTRMQIDKS